MPLSALTEHAAAIAGRLTERGEKIAVVESSAGGLISAALLSIPGASAYYRGGLVIYTLGGAKAMLEGGPPFPDPVRSSSEPFATWLAGAGAAKLRAGWGIGETGAAGPAGNSYGDPAGHSWVAVRNPDGEVRTQRVLTGSEDREQNMHSFAAAALLLLLDALA
jgi:nicotinamide-nucleotide amidase